MTPPESVCRCPQPGGNRPTPSAPSTGDARLRAFLRMLDKDGDGRISMDEAPPRLAERFEELDRDLDGYLSAEELGRALDGVGAPR